MRIQAAEQAVALLAGGHGRRFGGAKLFAQHGGVGFLERILSRCAQQGIPAVLAVERRQQRRLEGRLAAFRRARPAAPLLRLAWVDGRAEMLDSLGRALAVLQGWRQGFAGCWVWPVDAPFLSAAGWGQAVRTVCAQPQAVWKLRSGGAGGHPLWLPRSRWEAPPNPPAGLGRAAEAPGRRDAARPPARADGLRRLLGQLAAPQLRILELPGERLGDINYARQLWGLSRRL